MRNPTILALRYLAAFLVFYGHSYYLYGLQEHAVYVSPSLRYNFSSYVPLSIFFSLSGYLITQSWIHSKTPEQYLLKRLRRIYPALIAVVLLCIFVIGPLCTDRPIQQYFKSSATYAYLLNTFTPYFVTTLPGVFSGQSTEINGPLWTILLELMLYLTVFMLGIFGLRNHPAKLLIIAAFLLVLLWFSVFQINGYLITSGNLSVRILYSNFFIGSILYIYRSRIRYSLWLVAAITLLVWLAHDAFAWTMFFAFVIPYAVFALVNATERWHWPEALRIKQDYTYGFYLVAWPMQQLVIHYTSLERTFLHAIVYPGALAGLWAVFSWHCIEKRFLLKKQNPEAY